MPIVEKEEMDETEYLLSNEANRKHLEKALEDSKHPENFIRVDLENLRLALLDSDFVAEGDRDNSVG